MRRSELLHRRVLPAARRSNILVYFARTPAARLIIVDRRRFLQYRVHDSPRFFDIVLPRKQRAVAAYGVTEHPFIGIHLVGVRMVARGQLRLLANASVADVHHGGAQCNRHLRTYAKSHMISYADAMGKDMWRLTQAYDNLGSGDGQRLSGADIKRHALPAPGIDLEPQCGEGFDLRVRGDARLLPVPAKLPAHQVLLLDWWYRFEDLDLFVTQRLAVGSCRRLHRQIGQHLKQVVLNHVTNGPRPVVKRPAALDAEILRHGDLNTTHELTVPKRFQERICEAEEHHVIYRPLAEVVVDPEDMIFVKSGEQYPV